MPKAAKPPESAQDVYSDQIDAVLPLLARAARRFTRKARLCPCCGGWEASDVAICALANAAMRVWRVDLRWIGYDVIVYSDERIHALHENAREYGYAVAANDGERSRQMLGRLMSEAIRFAEAI